MKRPPSHIQPLVRLKLVRLNNSETDSLFIEDEEERYTQPILKRKVEKVTNMIEIYWGLVQDQFRREVFLKQPVKLL